jgi:hypothetical protein
MSARSRTPWLSISGWTWRRPNPRSSNALFPGKTLGTGFANDGTQAVGGSQVNLQAVLDSREKPELARVLAIAGALGKTLAVVDRKQKTGKAGQAPGAGAHV